MAKPTSASLPDQSATLRQLKLLVVILTLSNIGLGIFSFYLLRAVDKKYSALIGRSVTVLNDLQTVTALAVDAMRSTNPAVIDVPAAQGANVVRTARQAIGRDRDLRLKLIKQDWLKPEQKERQDFQTTGEIFTTRSNEVVTLYADGKSAEAVRLRESALRPAFEHYLTATTKVADVLQDDSLQVSDDLTKRTVSMSTVLLGLGSWPIAILGVLLLLTALFVVVLMVLFRGREMSDMP